MALLTSKTLGSLPESVAVPAYTPGRYRSGIVHLGTGAFHRAHQAVYTDTALAASGGNWRIVGSSLRTRSASRQLNDQDGLYSVVTRDAAQEQIRVVGAIERVIFAPDDPRALIEAIAMSETRILTLTVTEKGYCHDPAARTLDVTNEAIRSDLEAIHLPASAPGFIVAGLRARRDRGGDPLTVMSCDNLPDNGSITRNVVLGMAQRVDPSLAHWIDDTVSFPSTMVDRITPATTDADREAVATSLGVTDRCPVVTEPFSQWVVEDRFAAGRPAWETGGAVLVDDVAPYEKMKLRLLNGSHSTIACLGCVAGFDYVHEVIGESLYRRLIRAMMDREVTATLDEVDLDLDAYKDRLVDRFANPSLQHAVSQIAMDSSQKLPQRLLEPIRERLAAGLPIDCLTLAVAAWMRYVGGPTETGAPISVDDPLADELAVVRRRHGSDPGALARALLGIRSIFGDQLPENAAFVRDVSGVLKSLFEAGIEATVESTLASVAAR